MDPPLRERLRWRTAVGEGFDSPARRAPLARTAALLFGAAALICLTGVLVPCVETRTAAWRAAWGTRTEHRHRAPGRLNWW